MFLLETVVKIAAFGLAFLRLGWEIFDVNLLLLLFVKIENDRITINLGGSDYSGFCVGCFTSTFTLVR